MQNTTSLDSFDSEDANAAAAWLTEELYKVQNK